MITLQPLLHKGVHIQTYGCQMNMNDSERILRMLKAHGYQHVDTPEKAGLVIVNTCEVRENASEKLYSYLGNIAILKKQREEQGQSLFVIVAGCTAQAAGEEIKKRARCVDGIVGTGAYHLLPEMLEKLKRSKALVIELDFEENRKFDLIESVMENAEQSITPSEEVSQSTIPNAANNHNNLAQSTYHTHSISDAVSHNTSENSDRSLKSHIPSMYDGAVKRSAFLSIQEGCDKFCHFCIVPFTRGAEYSRPVEAIYREAQKLIQNGAKEIILLGQNVSAYHGISPDGHEVGLAFILEHLSKLNGVESLSYTTSHPMDMISEELFSMHKDIKKLKPYLHLPIQSGSDDILKAMNRKYTAQDYISIIEKYRSYRPDIAVSSDFIVGYPGETDADFEHTLEVIKKVQFAQFYAFKYSVRPGTTASMAKKQIPEDIKEKRLDILINLLREQQLAFNEATIGKSVRVLFEKYGKKPGQIIGKSPYMQSVIVEDGHNLLGQFAEVNINGASLNSLRGELMI